MGSASMMARKGVDHMRLIWDDAKAQLALDCELAEQVNRLIWKWLDKGIVGLAAKLNDAGVETTFAICSKAEQYQLLANSLIDDSSDAPQKHIYELPRGLKRTDSSYAKRARLRSLALKSRLIYFGTLNETAFDKTKKEGFDLLPHYRTAFAIFRISKTNRCLVHLFAFTLNDNDSHRRAKGGARRGRRIKLMTSNQYFNGEKGGCGDGEMRDLSVGVQVSRGLLKDLIRPMGKLKG